MLDDRWRSRQVPAAAALLLLPVVPAAVRVLDGHELWSEGLSWWGIRPDDTAHVALAQSVEAAATSGCSTLLVHGRDEADVLRSLGYVTTTWSAVSTWAGATALVTRGGPRPPRPRRWQPLLRSLAADVVRRSGGTNEVTVAARRPGPPALLAEAGFGTSAYLLTGGGGARRRPVFLTRPDGDGPAAALKISRAADADRAVHEQDVLRQVPPGRTGTASPRALGHGNVGGLVWSAESAVGGLPLADLLGQRPSPRRLQALLSSMSRWFADLAVATAAPQGWDGQDDVPVVLRGPYVRLATLTVHLGGVPAVLVHGDVGTAFNVLVRGEEWSVIDWETAQPHGLPLVDVLLLLTGALAAVSGARDAEAQGAYVLRLCAGDAAESGWFFSCIGDYLRRAGVPLDAAGALAALALGYQASMRLVQAEMVRAAGVEPSSWRSLWDHASAGWMASPALGLRWTALRDALVA